MNYKSYKGYEGENVTMTQVGDGVFSVQKTILFADYGDVDMDYIGELTDKNIHLTPKSDRDIYVNRSFKYFFTSKHGVINVPKGYVDRQFGQSDEAYAYLQSRSDKPFSWETLDFYANEWKRLELKEAGQMAEKICLSLVLSDAPHITIDSAESAWHIFTSDYERDTAFLDIVKSFDAYLSEEALPLRATLADAVSEIQKIKRGS